MITLPEVAEFSVAVQRAASLRPKSSQRKRLTFGGACWTDWVAPGNLQNDERKNEMPPLHPVHRGITSPRLKSAVFVVEGLNSLATTYFFYYLYFFMKARFQFGTAQNLWLAAVLGILYALGSFCGGRFAQRFGYFSAIQLGLATMFVVFVTCGFAGSWWQMLAWVWR